jgi:hypothetical protein
MRRIPFTSIYFNMQLLSWIWSSIDWHVRLFLNSAQFQLGLFRGVILDVRCKLTSSNFDKTKGIVEQQKDKFLVLFFLFDILDKLKKKPLLNIWCKSKTCRCIPDSLFSAILSWMMPVFMRAGKYFLLLVSIMIVQ